MLIAVYNILFIVVLSVLVLCQFFFFPFLSFIVFFLSSSFLSPFIPSFIYSLIHEYSHLILVASFCLSPRSYLHLFVLFLFGIPAFLLLYGSVLLAVLHCFSRFTLFLSSCFISSFLFSILLCSLLVLQISYNQMLMLGIIITITIIITIQGVYNLS